MGTVDPDNWSERWQVRLLVAAYKHRLREIIKVVPSWVAEKILSASEHVGEDRAAVWISWN